MSTLVGMQLNGRYRLDAQIGTGGMSTVYRAFDSVLERRVAVKLMHREIAADTDQLERFRREARSVAQLSHPHIVGVIDAGEEDGRPYIVFEYVEGETLKDRIRRMGRLPVDEAIAYAIEIARALGAAHARGIVHRDIKPQNVLVDEEGSAKVTDFGIARSLDEEGLTADGRVLGTTDYVSPEQALAAEAARTGTSTGEATAVLRTLPADARRRLPLRLRLRVPVMLLILMIAVAGAVVYLLLDQAAERAQKGTGTGVTKAPPGEKIVSVKRTSASDYDPLGDDKEEHSEAAFRAVDQDSDTAWTTED